MSNEVIQVGFFKDGSEEFFDLLDDNGLHWKRVQLFPTGTIVASGEIIEVIKAVGGASIIPSLAAIIIQWLKNRSSRAVMLQTKNKDVIHLKGYSQKEVEAVLDSAERLTIIQTVPDERKNS